MMPFVTAHVFGVWEDIVTGSPDEAVALTVPVLPQGIDPGTFSETVCVAGITVTLELPVALL